LSVAIVNALVNYADEAREEAVKRARSDPTLIFDEVRYRSSWTTKKGEVNPVMSTLGILRVASEADEGNVAAARRKIATIMERHVRSFLLPPMSERDAALLIRVSTKKQRSAGYSVEDQRSWGKIEAARLRLRLREYEEDESTSHSDSLDRIALNQLEEDIIAGKIGVLLLKYHDRLGRGPTFAKLIEFMKSWGVKIVCGDIPESADAADLLMSFYAGQGSTFLKNLRKRTSDGVRDSQKAGKHPGADLTSFLWRDGRWIPDETLDLNTLKPWQRARASQARKAYAAGELDALLADRRNASKDRHSAARMRQEQRNQDREVWLTQHRPLVIERRAL